MKFNLTDNNNTTDGLEVELNSLEELEQFIDFVGYDIVIISHKDEPDFEKRWTAYRGHIHDLTIEVYSDYRE